MSQKIPPRVTPLEDGQTDADKEQYSLDEMMKALREKEREKEEKGEVVTRSDGSVARKVKRRKRRSDQPESQSPEKGEKSFVGKLIVGVVLFLVLILVGVFLVFSHNTKGHRESLEKTASEWNGAEVEFNGFKRLPLSVRMSEARFQWPATSFLKSFEMKSLAGDANFSSFLGARQGGLQIGGKVGALVTGMPTASGEVGQKYEEDDFPFTYEQFYCQSLDVRFGESNWAGIKGTSANLNHVSNAGFQMTLDQGVLQVAGWNDFPISSGLLRFEEGVVSVKSLSLRQPVENELAIASTLKIAGDIPLFPGKKATLKTTTERYPLSGLIGKRLSTFFKGDVVSSTGVIEYALGEDQIDDLGIVFQADSVVMSGFPFLNNLRELFPGQDLEEINFNSGLKEAAIQGVFRLRPEGVAMESIEMAEKGNLRLKGAMIISEAGKIAGNITLSINRAFFAGEPRLMNHPALIDSERTGFVEVKFKLGGTIEEPDDSFREVFGMQSSLPGKLNQKGAGENDLWDLLQK